MNSPDARSLPEAPASGSQEPTGVFYLVVAPGFESVADKELRDWCPEAKTTVARGGIETRLPLGVGLELNRVLKTPTRILVRLADFGCRDFPKLYKKMSNFPWADWLSDDTQVEFQASTHNSRLRIKKRIEETCSDGRRNHLKKKSAQSPKSIQPKRGTEAKAQPQATVFVRFNDDVCTISLDTSGELLHKRGLRPLSSDAPLRETIAASLLLLLLESADGLREEGEGVQLVDPMTGGGTFLLEARDLNRPVKSRGFAFESFQPLLERIGARPELICARPERFSSFVGFDADPKAIESARENLSLTGDARDLLLENEDFFKAEPLVGQKCRWLIANPPYGERIQVKGRLADFYADLLAAAERVVRPERACFVFPEKASPKNLKLPAGWRTLADHRFSNGGLSVVAMIYGRERIRSGS